MRKLLIKFMALCLILFVCIACAATRKTAQSTSSVSLDSASLSASDSMSLSRTEQSISSVVRTDSAHTSTSVSEKSVNEETITEYITEHQDTAGNRTTTTERTLTKKGNYYQQTHTDEWKKTQEEQMNLFLSKLGSMARSQSEAYKTHWEKNDSLTTNNEKNTKTISHATTWQQIKSFCVLMIVLFAVVWCIQRTKRKD